MCGIVGAASARNIVPVLIDGVRRLEYRGYDSTGLAIVAADHGAARLERLVSTARVADLAAQAEERQLSGGTGISHTRWATHGAPSPVNAHPHLSEGEVAIVHNGIIENFEDIKKGLARKGHRFASETDSEVISHFFEEGLRSKPVKAVITDFMMPLMDGVMLCRTLRALSPTTPLIVSSERSPLMSVAFMSPEIERALTRVAGRCARARPRGPAVPGRCRGASRPCRASLNIDRDSGPCP